MIFLEDLEPLIYMKNIAGKTQLFSETLMQVISNSMSARPCGRVEPSACRDDSQSVILKSIAIASILAAGVSGVAIPLVGKKRRFLTTEGNLFFAAKAFAAGVILATGFVHMLPDASSALSDPCLPRSPWSKFPFSGFVAMMASLATMVADFVGTQYYERKQQQEKRASRGNEESVVSGIGAESESVLDSVSEIGIVPAERVGLNGKVFGEEDGGGMHIVGIHAHTVHHGHSHPQGKHTCGGGGHVEEDYGHDHHGHGHVHGHGRRGVEDEGGVRHVVVSQILEMGIVSHSVIIGLSLGVSHSPCTIRPLIGALSFHQFFEGFALGGCISQSHFSNTKTLLMACFFAITTPAGIGVGTAIASSYNNRSPRALAVEGVLDSVSAGILVYMALVDLIAADFMSKRMSCNPRLQLVSYVALFLGASLMSLLALWA